MSNRLALIACLAVISCDLGETEPDQPEDELAFSGSVEPAFWYNANPFKPTNGVVPYECIWPALGGSASTAARFVDGETAFYSWRALDWSGTTCLPGQLRIARWERVSIAGEHGYIMRGGGGDNADEVYGNGGIRFGHVLASQLAKETSVLTRYIPGRVGQAPGSCSGALYVNDPARGTTFDLSELYYKPDQPASSGAKWDNYGDQAGTGPTHYSYALWTWPVAPDGSENRGGGQIRAVVAAGRYIRVCDVQPVYLPMYPAGSGSSVGRVKMIYGRVRSDDGAILYGWFAVAWHYNGGDWHYLVD
jgi:hypothetical protein